MNIELIEERMIRALEGELSKTDYDQLIGEVEANEDLQLVWKDYQDLYSAMEEVPQDIPSPGVEVRFKEWLDDQQTSETQVVDIAQKGIRKGPIVLWRRWAGIAAILIGVLGFWQVYEHNNRVESQLASMTEQMKGMMEEQSSTARIKAIRVNYNPSNSKVDDKMIQVLIDVLNTDQSSNVRLAAVETLAQYMDNDLVRESLIKRLGTERDGGVKLSIITSLSQQQDESLKSTLENIVNDDSQEKFVIDEAHMQLIRYEKMDI